MRKKKLEDMRNVQKIILIAGAVVIVVLSVILLLPRTKTGSLAQNENSPVSNGQGSSVTQSATAAPVPAGTAVPNMGDKNVAGGVATPQIQTAAHPSGGDASLRQFAISVDNNNALGSDAFAPDNVIVKKGDIIDLEITAVNKDYDFTQPDYGFPSIPLPKGKTTKIQFQALNAGKFTFYCTSCGGPGKGPVGYVTITDK